MDRDDRLSGLVAGAPFITDDGLETVLIFHEGIDLPLFAAFDLYKDEEGAEALRRYCERYLGIARDEGVGFYLDTATWRASPDWAAELGYSPEALDEANRKAVRLAGELRSAWESDAILVNGVVGPRGDGYAPSR